MSETWMSLTLFIDKRKQRVLFAEGGKDFVDFLFTILSLSIGAVMKLLAQSAIDDCLTNLYESLEDLDPTYMKRSHAKATLLCTKPPKSINLKLSDTSVVCAGGCSCSSKMMASQYLTDALYCKECLKSVRVYVASAAGDVEVDAKVVSEGYVEDKVTYLIMDDLVVKPMSATALLYRLNNAELGSAEEKTVFVCVKKALELLKASLHSNTVLTDVFLAGRMKPLK